MKKIILLLISFLITSISLSYSQNQLQYKIEKKLIKIENKLLQYTKSKKKFCKLSQNFYTKLIKKAILYKNKYPKYKPIYNAIILVSQKRQSTLKNKCKVFFQQKTTKSIISKQIKNNSNRTTKKEATTNIKKTTHHFIKQWDFRLKSLIDKTYLKTLTKKKDIQINLKLTLPKTKLKKINQAKSFFKNYVNIKNNWYFLSEYIWLLINPEDIDYILQNADHYLRRNNAHYLIYWNYKDKIKVILVNKNKIKNVSFMNPQKDVKENIKNITKIWWIYISNPIYSYTLSWAFLGGLVNINENLFFLVPKKEQIVFLPINNNKHLCYSLYNLKFPIYIKNLDIILWFPANAFNFYYIWPKKLYEKVNTKQLGKVLFSNFQRISFYNYNYSVKQMYNLLNFSTRFNNKTLSDIWKWITKNLKYNSIISQITKKMDYHQFNQYIRNSKSLWNNWIIFYTLEKKEGVCETFSDLLSTLAILNWLNWDTIWGKLKDNPKYPHQISKINNYYYDPTYGIAEKNYNYFWMNQAQLSKYFIPEKK